MSAVGLKNKHLHAIHFSTAVVNQGSESCLQEEQKFE